MENETKGAASSDHGFRVAQGEEIRKPLKLHALLVCVCECVCGGWGWGVVGGVSVCIGVRGLWLL